MKKRLEAELISIAHRILKLKNKSEVDQLYVETRKLYEALSVLKFYGDNYEMVKSDVSREDLEAKLTTAIEKEAIEKEEVIEVVAAPEVVIPAEEEIIEKETPVEVEEEKEITEDVQEETIEEEEEDTTPVIVGEITVEDDGEEEPIEEDMEESLDFEPIFELMAEAPIEELKEEKIEHAKQISFEDLLGGDYTEPVFVKPNDVVKITPTIEEPKEEILEAPIVEEKVETTPETIVEEVAAPKEVKSGILNEKLATGISIGLNDRVGFVKYLFADSSEDFNRVLSQLNTFDSYSDAKDFIENMVKPDYSNWKGQEDYEERFMEIVERKFN